MCRILIKINQTQYREKGHLVYKLDYTLKYYFLTYLKNYVITILL